MTGSPSEIKDLKQLIINEPCFQESGFKNDSSKPDLDLVLGGFSRALQLIGDIGTKGAIKYTDHGWLSVPNGKRRYSSALLRHFFLESDGEYLDEELELPHAGCVAWNALARLELILLEKEKELAKNDNV